MSTQGQTIHQAIPLNQGWNAIYIEVEPTNNAIETVFADVPVEAVWAYFDKTTTVEFLQRPDELPWNNPSWRRYLPSKPHSFLQTLFTVNANRAYLVKVTNNATLNVMGSPSIRPLVWVPDSFNLRGFPIDPAIPPTFGSFFASARAHADQPIYRLDSAGEWAAVMAGDLMQSGEAYWVYSKGASDFTAPLELQLPAGDGLDYAKSLSEQRIGFHNRSSDFLGKSIHMEDVGAGGLPLSYYDLETIAGNHWVNLPSPYVFMIDPLQTLNRRLAIRRAAFNGEEFATALRITDGQGTRYHLAVSAGKVMDSGGVQGLWVGTANINAVNESNGFLAQRTTHGGDTGNVAVAAFEFPGGGNDFSVSAQQVGTNGNGLNIFLKSDGTVTGGSVAVDYEGGKNTLTIDFDRGATTAQSVIAALNELNQGGFNGLFQAQSDNGEDGAGYVAETTPTRGVNGNGSEFPLRVMLHVNTNQSVRLLKEVIQLWRDGSYILEPGVNPAQPGFRSPDPSDPGRFVLLTDDTRIVDFQGASLRDGEPVGRRISCVGFDFDKQYQDMTGSFGSGQELTTTFTLGFDHPTNPFRHRKHPDHDNKDTDFETVKREAPEVTRTIQLRFFTGPPPDLSVSDYGYRTIAGHYREELVGLHKRKLVVTGTFELNRVSFIGELNPPAPGTL